MALDDDAVVVAAVGYLYRNSVGATSPTPNEIDSFDPETFGCLIKTYKASNSPTSYTLTVGAGTTTSLLAAATPAQVQAALEALTTVGVGNVLVDPAGVSLVDTAGLTISWVGALQNTAVTMTATFTGGSSPALTSTVGQALTGWEQLGHSSRSKLPEFAYEGGKTKMRGSWQKQDIREVQDGDPIADSVTVQLEQWSPAVLRWYYGVNSASTPGVYGVDGAFIPVEDSVLIVLVDGDDNLGFYAPKASCQRDAAIGLPIDDFAMFPVKATFLNYRNRRLFDWISNARFPAA